MRSLRQLVGALLVLAVAALMPAPLLACAQMGHRCAMMMEQPQPKPQPQASEHDCCPKKAEAQSAKQCHEAAAMMPADCTMSSRCCEMGPAPVTNSTQMTSASKIVVQVAAAAITSIAPVLRRATRDDAALAPYSKPVFELKTDLRI